MKALVKNNWEPGLSLQDVLKPVPGEGEVCLRVIGSAICGSDLHIYESSAGYEWLTLPMTPGHEVCGTIDSVGAEVDSGLIGTRVVVNPYIPCGKCEYCRAGRTNLCDGQKMVLDKIPSEALQVGFRRPGGMADYVVVPAGNVITLPEKVSDDAASMLESFAVSVHATEQIDLGGTETVLVIGPGPIGLGVVAALTARGIAKILAAGLSSDARRLEIARQLGAERVFDASQESYAEVVAAETQGRGVDVVFDCSGHPQGLAEAIKIVRRGGKIVLVGIYGKPAELPANAVVRGEVTILGTYGTTPEAFSLAVRYVTEERVNISAMVTHVLPLSEAVAAFEAANSKSGCKIVLKP